MEVLM